MRESVCAKTFGQYAQFTQAVGEYLKKKILFLCLLVIFTGTLCAQKNSIKARALGIPDIYTMGIGYERFLTSKLSVQILFNHYGIDVRKFDGKAEITNALLPELRYYFDSKKSESINKQAYLGLFTDFARTNIFISEESHPVGSYAVGNRKMIAPGLIIGRNGHISKTWFFESYIGLKYKFVIESGTYFPLNQNPVAKMTYFDAFGYRVGFNVGVRF